MTAMTDALYMVYGTSDMMDRRPAIILSPDEKTKQLKLHDCMDVVVVIMIILPSDGGCWLLAVGCGSAPRTTQCVMTDIDY